MSEGTWTMTESEFKQELAKAWEEGWTAGDSDAYKAELLRASSGKTLDAEDMSANPYRSAK